MFHGVSKLLSDHVGIRTLRHEVADEGEGVLVVSPGMQLHIRELGLCQETILELKFHFGYDTPDSTLTHAGDGASGDAKHLGHNIMR